MTVNYVNGVLTVTFEAHEKDCTDWCIQNYTIQIFQNLMTNFIKGREAQRLDQDKQTLYNIAQTNPTIRIEAAIGGVIIKDKSNE